MVSAIEILHWLSEGHGTAAIAHATAKFAQRYAVDFGVLVAFHNRSPFGSRSLKKGLTGLAAVAAVCDRRRNEDTTAKAFLAGEAVEARETAAARYADALLRLDTWLLTENYRTPEKDRRAIDWEIDR